MRISKIIIPVLIVSLIVFLAIKTRTQKKIIIKKDNEIVLLTRNFTNLANVHRATVKKAQEDSVFFVSQINALESGLNEAEQEYNNLASKFQKLKSDFTAVKATLVRKDAKIASLNQRLEIANNRIRDEQNRTIAESKRADSAVVSDRTKSNQLDGLRKTVVPGFALLFTSTYMRENIDAYSKIKTWTKHVSENLLNKLYLNDEYDDLRSIAKKYSTNLEDTYLFLTSAGLDPTNVSKSEFKNAIRSFLARDYYTYGISLFALDEDLLNRIKTISINRFDI